MSQCIEGGTWNKYYNIYGSFSSETDDLQRESDADIHSEIDVSFDNISMTWYQDDGPISPSKWHLR